MTIQPEPPVPVSLAHTAGPTTRVSPKVTEGLLAFDLDPSDPRHLPLTRRRSQTARTGP